MTSVPLRLDLVRHGEAEAASDTGDMGRRLSPAGRATISQLAERLASEGWQPDAMWSSPLVRAQETAAILAKACLSLSVGTLEELIPDGEPEDIFAVIAQRSSAGHVVLVGHQPLMGRLVAWLTGGAEIPFRPGTLVRLDLEGPRPGSATIALQIPPSTPRSF